MNNSLVKPGATPVGKHGSPELYADLPSLDQPQARDEEALRG